MDCTSSTLQHMDRDHSCTHVFRDVYAMSHRVRQHFAHVDAMVSQKPSSAGYHRGQEKAGKRHQTSCRAMFDTEVQIARTQALVPEATLLCQDIMAVHFPSQTFAAIVAFFATSTSPCRSNVPSLRASSAGCGPVAISWSLSDTRRGQATKTPGTVHPCIGVRPMRPRTWPGCGTVGLWYSGGSFSRRAVMGMSWRWHSDQVVQLHYQKGRELWPEQRESTGHGEAQDSETPPHHSVPATAGVRFHKEWWSLDCLSGGQPAWRR